MTNNTPTAAELARIPVKTHVRAGRCEQAKK